MPANPADLWMHTAEVAELPQFIKEASLRVTLKTSCCDFSPHFCKSISKWSGLRLPTPAGAWTQSPLSLLSLYQAGKIHRQILYWVQTKVLYNRLKIVVVKECFPQSPRVYSKWSSFYWVLEITQFPIWAEIYEAGCRPSPNAQVPFNLISSGLPG